MLARGKSHWRKLQTGNEFCSKNTVNKWVRVFSFIVSSTLGGLPACFAPLLNRACSFPGFSINIFANIPFLSLNTYLAIKI